MDQNEHGSRWFKTLQGEKHLLLIIVIDPKSFLDPKRCFACAITYAWNPCNQVAWVMELPVNSGPPHSSNSDTAHRCSSGCSVLLHESHPGRATLWFFCCVFFRKVTYLFTFRAKSKPFDLLWMTCFSKKYFLTFARKVFFYHPKRFCAPGFASTRHTATLDMKHWATAGLTSFSWPS